MIVTSTTLNNFLNTLIESINHAILEAKNESIEANSSVIFVADSIDVNLKCSIYYKDNSIMITPSNAFVSNYYNNGKDSLVKVKLDPIMVSSHGKT